MLDQPRDDVERLSVAGIAIERLRFQGGGRPVLYLHPKDGPGGDRAFLSALAAAGLDVHAPWLPGFGHSDRPADLRAVRDLGCFAAAYLEEAGLGDALVVGASFGGWVAADLATGDAARASAFVLIDALGLKFGRRDEREIADFHSLPAAEVARRSWIDPPAHAPDPGSLDDATALAAARSEEAFALYGWRPYMHDPGLNRWLGRVKAPVAVYWGAADGIVSPDYGRRLAGLFPNGRFETIQAAAHYPTREQPAETARRVVAFAAER